MKKKMFSAVAMLAAGCMLCMSGCSVDVTTINEEEIPLEIELEDQNLAEGMIMMHMVWYDETGDKLSQASIAFYDEDTLIYSGETTDDGNLPTCALPCNTTIYCSVTDMNGDPLAESEIIIKLSDNYTELSLYPTSYSETGEGLPQCVIEVPTDKTNVRAAIFLTDDGSLSFSGLTPYVEPEATPEEPTASEEAAEEAEAEEAVEAEEAAEVEEAAEAEEEVTAIEIEEAVEEEFVEPEPEPEAESEPSEEENPEG